MSENFRVAHCSDIHLDGDVYSTDKQSQSILFEKMLGEIKKRHPHLLLIAGDLFDSNRASKNIALWAMAVISALPFDVFIIPGNHDCLQPNGVFERHDFNALRNVQMFKDPEGEVRWLKKHNVAVWGKGMEAHTPEYLPLSNCPSRPAKCDWYLGMGHGLYTGNDAETGRSSPISQQDIEDSPLDYIALGHHHAAMKVITETTVAAYSGSPTDDIGEGFTFALANLKKGMMPALEILTLENISPD